MLKISLIAVSLIVLSLLYFANVVKAEEIHFDNKVFVLKYSALSPVNKGYENEYFPANQNKNNWDRMVGIYYYPEISDPLKFASKEDKNVESTETDVLLKFIQNKKQDKAALSYLENGLENGKNIFTYNIYKYEKHPDKGMMVLRYAVKYYFTTNDEITQIGKKVREENDKYLEMIVSSPVPPIVEKDINE